MLRIRLLRQAPRQRGQVLGSRRSIDHRPVAHPGPAHRQGRQDLLRDLPVEAASAWACSAAGQG